MPRILFYVHRDMQLPFLEPIQEILAREKGMETVFSSPQYQPSVEIGPGWGLSPEQIKRLGEKSTYIPHASDIEADIAVVADNAHYYLHRVKRVVNIGHGLICKGFYYTDDPVVRKENLSRLICVPGPWHKKRLSSQVISPIEVTGFIKSDLLFGPFACSKQEFCSQKNIPISNRIVLFAPTFNQELNCLSRLGEKIHQVADSKTTLLIKLHNMTDFKWKEYFQKLATDRGNIHLLGDDDYSGMMHAADLMISDVSSIYLEFMFLDKPVILAPNPENEEYFKYDPRDIEYRAREGAYILKDDRELLTTVNRVLDHPGEKSKTRKKYRDELDFGRDGKSALRIAEAVKGVLRESPKFTPPRPQVSVILDGTGCSRKEVDKSVRELKKNTRPFPEETFLLINDPKSAPDESHKKISTVLLAKEPEKGLKSVLHKCSLKDIICLKCGYFLPPDWLKHMYLSRLWNEDSEALRAMAEPELLGKYFSSLYPGLRLEDFDIHTIQRMILVAAVGQTAPNKEIKSAALIASKNLLANLAFPLFPNEAHQKNFIFRSVNKKLDSRKTILALDIYMHDMTAPVTTSLKVIRKIKGLFARGEHLQANALLQKISPATSRQ